MSRIKRFNEKNDESLYTSNTEIKIIKKLYDEYLECKLTDENSNSTKEIIKKIYQTAKNMVENNESKIEAWVNAFEDESAVMDMLNDLI